MSLRDVCIDHACVLEYLVKRESTSVGPREEGLPGLDFLDTWFYVLVRSDSVGSGWVYLG